MNVVVMTPYTNATYRVDDVDFDTNASSEFFFKKENRKITYVEYYKMKYGIRIKDAKQPLLVSQTKPKDKRGSQPEYVYLVPELCMLTGKIFNLQIMIRKKIHFIHCNLQKH